MPRPKKYFYKNYFRTCRKKLGLTQLQVAEIIGLKSPDRISAMELGKALPTVQECLVLQIIFKVSFAELWPDAANQIGKVTRKRVLQLLQHLEQSPIRSRGRNLRAEVARKKIEEIFIRRGI